MSQDFARSISIACVAGIVAVLILWADRFRDVRDKARAVPAGVVIAPAPQTPTVAPRSRDARDADSARSTAATVDTVSRTTAMLADPGSSHSRIAERLLQFQPATLSGLPRVDVALERDDSAGTAATIARARYVGGGRQLELRISDLGGPRGVIALAGWALADPRDATTEDGLEQVWRASGRVHYRQYDNASMTGEAAVLLGERLTVSVTARGQRLPAIAAALGAVDLAGLEALARMR